MPVRRSRNRSGSARSNARAGCAARCPWLAQPSLAELLSACEDLLAATGTRSPCAPPTGRTGDLLGRSAGPAAAPRIRLEYASMAWMTGKAAVAIVSGIIASAIALTAFGLDSVIEFLAAVILVCQLPGVSDVRETRAVHQIGVTFFALAAVSIHDLVSQTRPEQSVPGTTGPPPAQATGVRPQSIQPPVCTRGSGRFPLRRPVGTINHQAGTMTCQQQSIRTAVLKRISAHKGRGLPINAWLDCWWAPTLQPRISLPLGSSGKHRGLGNRRKTTTPEFARHSVDLTA